MNARVANTSRGAAMNARVANTSRGAAMNAVVADLPGAPGTPASRRDFLRGVVRLAVIVSGTAACGKTAAPFTCAEPGALAPGDVQVRAALGYTERAADATRSCAACQQYVPAPTDGACGSCKVLKGSIHPLGTCRAFSAKST